MEELIRQTVEAMPRLGLRGVLVINNLLFGDVPRLDILYFVRRVGGFDYWPVPLIGNYPRPNHLFPITDADLETNWREFLSTNQTYTTLMQMERFRNAYAEFKNAVAPDIKREIRYFHIVSNAINVYLLELAEPKFMGLGTRSKRRQAIGHVDRLLELIRDGLNFGILGTNENHMLALALERYKHNLTSENVPRNDETVRERRFLKLLILEFLRAFDDPLQKVIINFYYIVSRTADDMTATKLVATYINQVRAEQLEPGLPTSASWYQEGS